MSGRNDTPGCDPLDGIVVDYDGDASIGAGSRVRFELRLTAATALPAGAEIGLARRWPSDWGTPQANDPQRADFVRVVAGSGGTDDTAGTAGSGGARAVRWWNARVHAWHPFDHVLFVALPEGLDAGEVLRVRFGGDAGDGPGFTAQTFIEESAPLSVRARSSSPGEWREIARPTVRIVGAEPHRLVLTAPSSARAGQPFRMHVRIEDEWGNPARISDRADPVHIGGLDAPVRIPAEGWTCVDMTVATAGVHRIAARSGALAATSNPVVVADGAPADAVYWGDLHAQSVIGCGARTIDAYYRHARDFAATDFASHQANCFLVSNDEWSETAASTARIHEDGRFVALLGVEWSAASAYGGDHNLYFPGDRADLRRCSHEFVADKSDAATDLAHVDDLHAHYRGTDTLVAVHVGGRTADLRWHEPSLERLIEVHSTHATSEWFLLDALRRGYRMGVIAGSDSVDGRPGASHPGHMGVRNVRGGLTAVRMPSLTRAGLWTALHARHCYGTTGARILLEVSAGGAGMGDEIAAKHDEALAFDVRVEGTAPIEAVDFFRDDAPIATHDAMTASEAPLSTTIRVAWNGTTAPGNWQRARMAWDGAVRVEGAAIVDARPWALDTPDEGIVATDAHAVRFRTITAGDFDGLLLTLDRIDGATLSFVTDPMSFALPLSGLGAAPRVFALDNPARRVEIRRMPSAMPPPDWRGSFADRDAPEGSHAYWVRVRQADGEMAWSTPIFVTRGAQS